jgi:choline dehydrogenase-like flavoprotein
MFSKKYNWMFDSEPVTEIRNGQPVFCPQGKGLGGGSAINAMIYIRGHRSDYDHWAALGNRGWGFDDLLPYFRKNECNERGGDEYHGDSGPLYVSNCWKSAAAPRPPASCLRANARLALNAGQMARANKCMPTRKSSSAPAHTTRQNC